MNDEQAMKQKNRKKSAPPETGIPPHVLRFLNSLPTDADPLDWITKFKEALQLMLGDVDRIALFINMNYSLFDEDYNSYSMVTSQIGKNVMATKFAQNDSLIEVYKDHLRQAGFPFREYQTPVYFTYSLFTEQSSLGALWLFRRRGGSPISARTIETMERLRPFMLFALSHRVAQNAIVYPHSTTYFRIVNDLLNTIGLTPREKEVLPLRLLGLQNKTIADKLFLSEETIAKHVRKILRKGKSHSFIELFMRYYVPELDDPDFIPAPPPVAPRRSGRKNDDEHRPAMPSNTLLIW